MTKAVIYARVSSKEQEKGYSIPAQLKFLKDYSEKNFFEVVEIYSEAETAKKAGRKEFNEMIRFLKKHPDIKIILAEKTDRIYRNLKDYITLDDFKGLEVHLVKENMIISDNSSSHEKFIHAIKVLMAKNYIDNLGEEAHKGQIEKAEEGIYPNKAPVGYKNIVDLTGRHIIEVDKERAKYIKKVFELYATGDYSAVRINKILFEEGFKTPRGNKYSKATIERILRNRFYIGQFEFSGKIYENATHEPLIDFDLFNIVRNRLNGHNKARSHNVTFPYANMIECGHCGGKLSAELKKGKYIYYHCNGLKDSDCKRSSYINQNDIDAAIEEFIKRLKLDRQTINTILDAVKEIHTKKCSYDQETAETINKQIQVLSKRIEHAYIDKADGNIPEDFWRENYHKWHAQKDELYEKLKRVNNAGLKYYESCELILKFCEDAPSLFMSANDEDKRTIINIVFANLKYKDRKLLLEPFSVFYDILKYPVLIYGGNDEARTRDLMRDRHAL